MDADKKITRFKLLLLCLGTSIFQHARCFEFETSSPTFLRKYGEKPIIIVNLSGCKLRHLIWHARHSKATFNSARSIGSESIFCNPQCPTTH